MIYRILSTALIALLALTACESEPGPADWCYNYDFALANTNSDGDTIGITAGLWEEGTGLLSVNNELVVSWPEAFFTRPVEVSIAFSRLEPGDINVAFQAVVFGAELAYQQSIAAGYPEDMFGANFPISSGGGDTLEEGNTVQFVVQSSAPIAVHLIQIRGVGVNPFPRDDCAPPEETPTPPVTSTVGPTNTPTPGPSPTPELCPTVIWDFDVSTQGWGPAETSWPNSVSSPHKAELFVHVPDTSAARGFIHDGNVPGTSGQRQGLGAGIYDLNLSNSCNLASLRVLQGLGAGSAAFRWRFLVNGSWIESPPVFTSGGSYVGAPAWDTKDMSAYGIAIADIEAIEVSSFSWGGEKILEIQLVPDQSTNRTPTPAITPTGTNTHTPTRTALFIPSPTPSNTPRPTLVLQTRTFTPQATPTPGGLTPTGVNMTFTPPPSSTPGPTNTPPPSSTPGPSNTPRATSTLISLPSPVGTEVGGTPIPGPQLTPIPGTPSFGTPEQIGTPNATWVGTPVYEATYLPTPDNLDEWHDQAESQLGTAVAYMNQLPTEWNSLMPDVGNVGAFAGYAKYAMSGVNLQEIFGVTVYPIVQHSLYGFVVVLIVASARMIWRLVLVAFKFAAWIVRWILKIIPFIG